MITINGHLFVRSDRDFTATLFRSQGTAFGYVKRQSAGCFLFMDMQKVPIAAVVNNRHLRLEEGPFWVSCHLFEGKTRYLHSTMTCTEKLLGIPSGYADAIKHAGDTWNFLNENWSVKNMAKLCIQDYGNLNEIALELTRRGLKS